MDEDNILNSQASRSSFEPPAGIVFSNILPSQLIIGTNEGSYEYIEKPHAQDTYTRHLKHKSRMRVDPMSYHAILERRLRILANSGYNDELRTFLKSCYSIDRIINKADSKKRTALHFAASRGSDEIVHILLEHGADPNLQDYNGNTPLHLAACTHHIRVITLLLRFGADVTATDAFGKTPLHLSLSRLRLLQSRDPNKAKSQFSAEKLKAEVGEIVAMLKEYFDKSGRKDDHLKICEINERLMQVHTADEVDEIGSLLSNFTQMTIDAAALAKAAEE